MYHIYLTYQIIYYIRLVIEPLTQEVVFNETHPDWKAKTCLTFKDHNVLQEGLFQAQILTNTVCLPYDSLNHIENLFTNLPENIDDIVKRYIFSIICLKTLVSIIFYIFLGIFRAVYTSNIFDAHQEKLPKRKDPNRPAWVFPRDYGITNARKMLVK